MRIAPGPPEGTSDGAPHIQTPSQAEHGLGRAFSFEEITPCRVACEEKEEKIMERKYPETYAHLIGLMDKPGKELGGTMAGFGQLPKQALADGALATKFKELITLAIASPPTVKATSLPTFGPPSGPVPPDRRSRKPSASPSTWGEGRRWFTGARHLRP